MSAPLEDLKAVWARLQSGTLTGRTRAVAAEAGASEGQLVAAGVGNGVVRLRQDWAGLIAALPAVGEVMCLTRNDHVIHEKHGRFEDVRIGGKMGLVLGSEIDLRLLLSHWHHAFAVSYPTQRGVSRSLQVYDADGTAVLKVFATAATDTAAFNTLATRFDHPDQSPGMTVQPVPPVDSDRTDTGVDVDGFRARWDAITDVHQFFGLLKDFSLSRHRALEIAGPDRAERLDPGCVRPLFENLRDHSAEIMVFVNSPGCIQIHTGPVATLKEAGGHYNVLDPRFNLHLRDDQVATMWAVRKPSVDGPVVSVEFFDSERRNFMMMFGARREGRAQGADWQQIVANLPRLGRNEARTAAE